MKNRSYNDKVTARLRTSLLRWYDEAGRTLPWRIRPEDRAQGRLPDPYAVWLSEIMCQQTTVAAVIPYWQKFLTRWPHVQDLAAAPREDVLAAWAGLGYYARARNLHKCAQIVTAEHKGVFPAAEAELLKLPGIGPYTAAAIAAICSSEATNVVDGNVERVISRLYAVQETLPGAKAKLKSLAGQIADPARPGDYAQAIMDLGAVICRPKSPKCDICPWGFTCAAKDKAPETYPKRAPKKPRPTRYGAVFYLENEGEILLRRRADKGLLGGMTELPGTEWLDVPADNHLGAAPMPRNWERVDGNVTHVFTHFTLILTVYRAEGAPPDVGDMFWAELSGLDAQALPSLMLKAIRHAKPA